MHSPEPVASRRDAWGALDDALGTRLLEVARRSLEHGLESARPWIPEAGAFPEPLRIEGASFVSLYRGAHLRGCIGALEPRRPLIEDVAWNAFAAGFRDPRFPALASDEVDALGIHVSVLGPLEPIDADSEASLLAALRPGVDGLVIEWESRRGTFLPSVWSSLPDPGDFLLHLKRKAGFAPEGWPRGARCARYVTKEWSAPAACEGR